MEFSTDLNIENVLYNYSPNKRTNTPEKKRSASFSADTHERVRKISRRLTQSFEDCSDDILEETSPEISGRLIHSLTSLKLSRSTRPPEERLNHSPRKVSDTSTGGCYFIGTSGERLIIKPNSQEAGAPLHPKHFPCERKGITPGQSAVRERVAWMVQKFLKLDFGVPATALCPMRHEMFNAAPQLLCEISEKNIAITQEEFLSIAYIEQAKDRTVNRIISEKREPILRPLRALGLSADDEKALIEDMTADPFPFRGQDWSHPLPQEVACEKVKLFRLSEMIRKQKGVEEPLGKLWELFCGNLRDSLPKTLVSAQDVIENTVSLEDEFDPNGDDLIQPKEFQKFLLDVILYNLDRHLGNILIEKESYTLYLIDHGYTLPHLIKDQEMREREKPIYEFLVYPQTHHPIDKSLAETINSLDVDGLIHYLKGDLDKLAKAYPAFKEQIYLAEECYSLIHLNLLLLKHGIKEQWTLHKIASFQLEDRFLQIFDTALKDDGTLDTALAASLF